ncbi:hypothetical protein EXIGLDRAFT_784244 [Exidia glandulosa HHB12029]|uniref:Uncharacterized protein n=1 Tax=Exidia glandulosa HHB12029 TaxID=1314781 RepID=A0A166MKV1_EXIGL|nr:hypothetical protein EXIGLDRAFT_784244 [Exidia glandulosa HHB12029]
MPYCAHAALCFVDIRYVSSFHRVCEMRVVRNHSTLMYVHISILASRLLTVCVI